MPLKIKDYHRTSPSAEADAGVVRLMLGMDGRIVFASPAFEELAGQGHSNGIDFLDIASFEDPDEAFRHSPLLFAGSDSIFTALRSGVHTVRFAATGETADLQFDIVQAQNGNRFIVASALANDQDFNASVQDFINHPPAENDTHSPFAELTSDLLVMAREDGTFAHINDTFTQTLGFALDNLEGRSLLDLVHPDDRAVARPMLQNLMHGEADGTVSFECRMISSEARIHWVEWNHKCLDGRIYSAGRDITHIKRLEQALADQERQLSEAEAIGHMGHWHWPIGQQAIEFSDEIYRIFGVTRDQFHPMLDSVSAMLHRRDSSRMMQVFQRAIIEQNDHEVDFRVMTPAGETRYVRCQGRCEFDGSGDVVGLYGIMQDVTPSYLHERALRESKEAAERAYAAKSQFLANMSHELRTPLNAIIGFSEMMQQQLLGPIGNDKYLDYIKGIRESGEHLLELITDILDMSKLEAGKYELALEDIKIAKIIRLAVHMMEGRAVEAGIRMNIHVSSEDMQITADRRAIMQIMLNLLSNAVKFSHPEGRINVECIDMNEFVSIRVRDHGIGIPAHKLSTITNPFEQAANQYTRGHEGSGLGLSITKELAELHGGSIHIESQIDVGTTVTIRLPKHARSA